MAETSQSLSISMRGNYSVESEEGFVGEEEMQTDSPTHSGQEVGRNQIFNNLDEHLGSSTGENNDEYDSSLDPQEFCVPTGSNVDAKEVIRRIEQVCFSIIRDLEDEKLPTIQTYQETKDSDDWSLSSKSESSSVFGNDDNNDDELAGLLSQARKKGTIQRKEYNLQQARSLTSIMLVLQYCHQLLLQHKTTTVREVYYAYVTYFKHQKECDAAIRDAASMLRVPRHGLGLKASPRGWFIGDCQMTATNNETGEVTVVDARAFPSVHGAPIDSLWIQLHHNDNDGTAEAISYQVSTTAAQCILVIEKEGIYNRLAEDRFFEDFPCILVCGKGFPDMASRAMVHYLHKNLELPVWGLCDCNPFGLLVLHTYQNGSFKRGHDGGARFGVPIQWVGLRPSQIRALQDLETGEQDREDLCLPLASNPLPEQVFQKLSDLDESRLADTLMSENHPWQSSGNSEQRWEELEQMLEGGFKVELEALQWLGLDYFNDFLGKIFTYQQELDDGGHDQEESDWRDVI